MITSHYLKIISKKNIDYKEIDELEQFLKEKDIELYFVEPEKSDIFEECKKLILEDGPSMIFSYGNLTEEVLAKTNIQDSKSYSLLIWMLREKLTYFTRIDELIIIDNYFFNWEPAHHDHCMQLFEDVFSDIIPNLDSFKFITKPKYNNSNFNAIKNFIHSINSKIYVSVKTSKDFHDRFWIVDEKKGLFIGTSLNGIGNKYALVDYLQEDDVNYIVNVLNDERLI